LSFPKPTLALLDRSNEVDIETRSPKGTVHAVPIWVVVDGDDVFIRTYRGPKSRWYRELLAGPGALVVNGKRIGETRVGRLPQEISQGQLARFDARSTRVAHDAPPRARVVASSP